MTERNENLDIMVRVGGVVKCPIKCSAIVPNLRDLFENLAKITFVCELKIKTKLVFICISYYVRTEKPFCAYLQIVAHFVASAVTFQGTLCVQLCMNF